MEYQYRAVNQQGQNVSGQIDAVNERDATRLLTQKDLIPVEILADDSSRVGLHAGTSRRASANQKALVIRELSVLLQAGISLAEAVESIGQTHTESIIGITFRVMHARLRAGDSFSQALRFAQMEWPDFLYQLVEAGEHTGRLAHALESAAIQMEYEHRIQSEMRSALIYPTVLVFSGIAATLLIFIVVVPKFAGMLKNSRAEIPALSVWVLKAGLFVKEHLLWVGLSAVAVAFALISALANPVIRRAVLQKIAYLPLIGRWIVETEMGRWAAMLGTLLENRVPISRAMELAMNGMQLTLVKNNLSQVLKDVRAGQKIADAMAASQVLNQTGVNLIRVGERSGELAGMLRALATLYENAGRERLKRFMVLLEPMAILIIGGVIGTIMIAIMLAITSLNNVSL